MSNELRTASGSGNTLYANIVNPSAKRWNGTDFETYASGSYPNYVVTLTEQGSSGVYIGDFPSGITDDDTYEIYFYLQQGGSPAEGDPVAGVGEVNWDGVSAVSTGGIPSGVTSNELKVAAATGNSLYAHVISPSGRRWNGTTFEVYASGSYSNYNVTMTEQGASGVYIGSFPSTITDEADYEIYYYLQQGASPAEGDPVAGIGSINWNGSNAVPDVPVVSGELSVSDWLAYILRTFKRTDKTTEVYEATNEAIAEIRRTFSTVREEKETALTDQITILGDYRMNVETDLGLNVSDVFIRDGSHGRYLIPITKAMYDYLYSKWGTASNHRRKPIHWCLFGRRILVGPVPDLVSYTYVVSYSKDDHVLVTASTTSVPFTTTDYREILKHGVLARLYALVENDVQAQKYWAFWKDGMRQIERKEDRNRRPFITIAYSDF